MRISLKQAEITKAIAFYLTHARGLQADATLQIKYQTTRVGPGAGVSAEFDIEDNGQSQAAPVKAEAPAKRSATKAENPNVEPSIDPINVLASGEAGVSEPGTEAAGGFVPAVEAPAAADIAQEATSATGDEVLAAQAEDAAADAAEAQPDTSKGESLFN